MVEVYRTKTNQDIDEIEPNLYLGSIFAAEDQTILREFGITHIVQVLESNDICPQFSNIVYHHSPIMDRVDGNLIRILPSALKFIHTNLVAGGKVFVHCAAGISRSSSIIVAYLMAKHKLPFEDAYNWVKSKRSMARPNNGFQRQLKSLTQTDLDSYLL
ncbi:unnamed protein product [Blepharisma stoltei]|uniref:Uncharacterized protein n=1 Tax=Blepharisma stoltei TaxID=1481888 RepID=A0AAU9K430_9CILI|nr:unnamed protein product [Blepharisma stoltei]